MALGIKSLVPPYLLYTSFFSRFLAKTDWQCRNYIFHHVRLSYSFFTLLSFSLLSTIYTPGDGSRGTRRSASCCEFGSLYSAARVQNLSSRNLAM
ncbi:hypothetical protein N7475_008173 [Penicillium sp. IBT 31633x]|nr:hypothetical protein N7475_008173 [Penicillium sp. IBT 31633x]